MIDFNEIVNFLKLKFRVFFGADNRVDYVTELPVPLTPEEESIALDAYENGDENARERLIEHNLRLVVYIAKRFDNTGYEMDELISVGTLGLIKAVKSFSRDKNIKLATFASRCIENEILMYLRKMVRVRTEVSLDEPLNTDSEGNQLVLSDVLGTDSDVRYKELESAAELEILRAVVKGLSVRDRKIIAMRYGLFGESEKTQKEVADEFSISQSYISRLEKKILLDMRKEFTRFI